MFLNENYRRNIKQDGYCALDLKMEDAIPLLEQLYNENFMDSSRGGEIHVSLIDEFKKVMEIHQGISNICDPYLASTFSKYEIYAAHFITKPAFSPNQLQFHQDWNNVDELKNHSIQLWIPLKASNMKNGGMAFIPHSHTFFNNLRSGSFDIPRIGIDRLKNHMKSLSLNQGQAVAFYPSTFHASFENSSEEPRIAVLINLIPTGSQSLYYHKVSDKVEIYEMNTKALYSNLIALQNGERPKGVKMLNQKSYTQKNNTTFSENDLLAFLSNNRVG